MMSIDWVFEMFNRSDGLLHVHNADAYFTHSLEDFTFLKHPERVAIIQS